MMKRYSMTSMGLFAVALFSSRMIHVGAWSGTCNLENKRPEIVGFFVPTSTVAESEESDDNNRSNNDRLLRDHEVDDEQREELFDREKPIRVLGHLFDEPSSSENKRSRPKYRLSYTVGRLCDCGPKDLIPDESFYCRLDTNMCEIRKAGSSYEVFCFVADGWKTKFARSVWFYLLFGFLVLFLYCFCSASGHHAIKYFLSKCIPGMNTWIVEQLLNFELFQRDEDLYKMHLERCKKGWLIGYKVKTKLYSSNSNKKCDKTTSNITDDTQSGESSVSDPSDSFCSGNGDEEGQEMCSICILHLEDGDRIANLRCSHLFHADCFSEWVLRKNSCPLCKASGIVEEMRAFEMEENFVRFCRLESGDPPRTIIARMMHEARNTMIGFFVGFDHRRKQGNRLGRVIPVAPQ